MNEQPDKIHVYRDEGEEWRWRRRAPNGEIVAVSGEGYSSKQKAVEAAHREALGVDLAEVVEDPD